MQESSVTHAALRLYDAGLTEILPVAPPGAQLSPHTTLRADALGKVPAVKTLDGWAGFDWRERAFTRRELAEQIEAGASIGIRARYYPGVDVDVPDPEIAATLRAALSRVLPGCLVRVGRAPRFLIPTRTATPFPKRRFVLRDASGADRGVVEILGDKQQYLIDGVHPTTGQRYAWFAGEREGGLEMFAERSIAELPLISAEKIESEVLPTIEEALAGHGISVMRSASGAANRDVDQETLRAPSIDALREAVAMLPNGDDVGRDRWIAVGHGIKAAAGQDNAAEGLSIFQEWSARWTGGDNNARSVEDAWNGFRGPYSLGWSFLAEQARRHGYNDAAFDFEAVEQATQGVPNEPVVAPLPTDCERLAALTGLPDRVIYIESAHIKGPALFDRFKVLQAAVSYGDPLIRTFRSFVLEKADTARRYSSSFEQFSIMLAAKLSSGQRWASLSQPNRDLLCRAAFIFVTDFGALRVVRDADALVPVVADSAEQPELVRGLIPEGARAMFVGAPASGKTSLALILGAAIATPPDLETDPLTLETRAVPRRFADRDVPHGRVIYFASEYAAGVARRKRAWADDATHLTIFDTVPILTDVGQSFQLVMRAVDQTAGPDVPPVKLIICDVARDMMIGDENSSEVVGAAMATCELLCRATGATVLLCHHSGKSAGNDIRGSSAFEGAQDFFATIKLDSGVVSFEVKKRREGPKGEAFYWSFADDGTLRYGRTVAETDVALAGEPDECVAARVLWHEVTAGESISKRDYRKAIKAQHIRFADSVSGPKRITRAIEKALEVGHVAFEERKEQYRRGPNEPHSQVLEPGALEIGQ